MHFFNFKLNVALNTLIFLFVLSILAHANAVFSFYNNQFISENQLFVSGNVSSVLGKKVLLGGQTVGFEYNTKGVLVIGKNKLFTNNHFIDNIQNNELMQGDIITEVNGTTVNNASEISNIINKEDANKENVTIKAIRKGKDYETNIKPAYDLLTKKYKLGLWVKNKINGLGTLTYIDPTNNTYGALGHAVIEGNANCAVPVLDGFLYDCAVIGVKRATRGNAGEIRGILKTSNVLGTVNNNTSTGIYGNLDASICNNAEIELGGKQSVVPGKALIYCCLDGKNVRAYDIEIIKLNNKNANHKDMVIKVTDQRLIKTTGGIVQGMSGSPIVQNGKLIGAVTHVFLNDATKGFGIFIDNMIKN